MNTIPSAIVAVAISILAGTPAIARAEVQTANPIVVTRATVSPTHGDNAGPNVLNISFRNESHVDATKVVFAVTGGWYRQQIEDVGRFTAGVSIDHAFLDYSGSSERTVDVVEVDFVDGTSWKTHPTVALLAPLQ